MANTKQASSHPIAVTPKENGDDPSIKSSSTPPPVTRSAQGTQAENDHLVDQLDHFMTVMDQAIANTKWPSTSSCPYHKSLLQFGFDVQITTADQAQAMDQYSIKAEALRPSMFHGADGKLSTYKACKCWMVAAAGSS